MDVAGFFLLIPLAGILAAVFLIATRRGRR
jgi:hypothetical protein